MVSRKKKLAELVAHPDAASVIRDELNKRRLTHDGKLHDFYTWLPRCAPFVTDGVRPGSVPNLTFQRDLPQSKARMIGLCTANGVGKTEVGAHLVASRAMGRHPVFKELSWNVPQLIWVCGEPDLLPGLFQRVLKYIPKSQIVKKLDSQAHQYLQLKNGSEIKFKSTGMDREAFQMDNVNFAWCDEEPPQKIWIELCARLRCPDSQVLLTFTPVKGTTFMHDTLEMESRSKHLGAMEGKIALFGARMEDNDVLPQDFIDDMKFKCRADPDMYAIRIEGDYRELRGRRIFLESELAEISAACKKPPERVFFGMDGKPQYMKVEYDDSPGWEVWKRPIPGMKYAACADLSEGSLTGDYTAAFVVCADTGEAVARYHGKCEPSEFAREFYLLGKLYNTALLGWEKNMQGAAVYDVLFKQLHYPRLYKSENFSGKILTDLQAYGFRTDKNSKMTIIQNLKDAIHDKAVKLFDSDTVDELLQFGYIRKEEASSRSFGMGAMSGHDDLVMALALTWHISRRVQVSAARHMEPHNFGDWLEAETLKEGKAKPRAGTVRGGLMR